MWVTTTDQRNKRKQGMNRSIYLFKGQREDHHLVSNQMLKMQVVEDTFKLEQNSNPKYKSVFFFPITSHQ